MNLKNTAAILITLFIFSELYAQDEVVIQTSSGTIHKMPPPEACINSQCSNGILVVAKEAGAALAVDINKAKLESDKAVAEIASLENEYKTADNNYAAALAPYQAKMDKYKVDNNKYTGDVDAHNARVAANNSLPADKRSKAEVDYLNQNKIRLDQWKGGLDQWKKNLDADREPLYRQWQELESKRNNLKSKAADMARLQLKINALLEQLKKCDEYGKRALAVAKEKNWGTYTTANDFFGSLKIVPSIGLLNGSLEKMKAWSNKSWD